MKIEKGEKREVERQRTIRIVPSVHTLQTATRMGIFYSYCIRNPFFAYIYFFVNNFVRIDVLITNTLIINIRKNSYYSFLSILGEGFSLAPVLLDPFE